MESPDRFYRKKVAQPRTTYRILQLHFCDYCYFNPLQPLTTTTHYNFIYDYYSYRYYETG